MGVSYNQFKSKIEDILFQKNFSDQERQLLLNTFLFMYENYDAPIYDVISKENFLDSYVQVLNELKRYSIIELSDINLMIDENKCFRDSIMKSELRNGNLEYINGCYVPVESGGTYYCSVVGFASKNDHSIFCLNNGNFIEQYFTCIHEMTHLTEGDIPFPILIDLPFRYEFRKMCCEGRAVMKENLFSEKLVSEQSQLIDDGNEKVMICSDQAYPLYSLLYQFLQHIVGYQLMDDFANNSDDLDMLEVIKNNNIEFSVEELYAHIVYILSCDDKYNELKESIFYHQYKRTKAVQLVVSESEYNEQLIENMRFSLGDKQQLISHLKNMLEDSTLLKLAYDRQIKEAEGSLKKDLEKYETFDCYVESQKYLLLSTEQEILTLEQQINELENVLRLLNEKKRILGNDIFLSILEDVCINHASLDRSFDFLYKTSLNAIKNRYKNSNFCDENIVSYEIIDLMKLVSRIERRWGLKNQL